VGSKQVTLYVPIVKGYDRTGIYFPEKYDPGPKLDLILYFHGLLNRCSGSASDTIEKYWTNRHFRLREMVNASGKNVVLVAPRLGDFDNYLSKLGMEGDDFLKAVKAIIQDRVKTEPFSWTGEMNIRNIVLAAHSGGGTTMRRLIQTVTVGTVCECWGFDSLYNAGEHYDLQGQRFYEGLKPWIMWAAKGGKFFLFWTDEGGTESNVRNLEMMLNRDPMYFSFTTGLIRDPTPSLARPNMVIEYAPKPKTVASATASHCDVPKTFMPGLLTRPGNCLS
jgi:hypothetical protein